MSGMKLNYQAGIVNILLVPFILVSLLLIASGSFAVWAFQSRQIYKNNVDQKISVAVADAKKQQNVADTAKFNEDQKNPLRTYNGPSAYGSIIVNYPKTWSAYVDESGQGNALVDGYFQPGTVPSITDQNSTFALHIQVIAQNYSTEVASLSNQQSTSSLKITPFALAQVPSVVGIRADGQISQTKTGTIILLPLRDTTLEISTEATQYLSDFNNYILPNLKFSP